MDAKPRLAESCVRAAGAALATAVLALALNGCSVIAVVDAAADAVIPDDDDEE